MFSHYTYSTAPPLCIHRHRLSSSLSEHVRLTGVFPQAYERSWTLLCCSHSLICTQTFRRALTASADSCAEIQNVLSVSGATMSSGRVRRKVPENDARSVRHSLFTSEHLSTDADSALGNVWVLTRPSKQHSVEART